MNRTIKKIAFLAVLLESAFVAVRGLAQDIPPPFGANSLVNITCNNAGFNCEERGANFFAEALGMVVFALLSFTGVVFTVLVLYGGYRWMLARGNESEVDKAKSIIKSAVIGLIVTLASYSIWLTISYFI